MGLFECILYFGRANDSEWRVNEHFNSFPRSLVSTFLYLAGFSDYVLLTSGGQQFAQIAKWISLALLGGFASPLLKQALDAFSRKSRTACNE